MCAGPGSMKISVLAHQIITTPLHHLLLAESLDVSRIAFSMLRLLTVCIVLSASMRLTYSRSNAAGIGRTSRRASLDASMCLPPSSTPARVAATYASSGNGSHAPKTMSSSDASGRNSLISGRVLGALAEPDRAHLGQRTDRRAHAALDQFDAGDQRGRHRAESDGQYAAGGLLLERQWGTGELSWLTRLGMWSALASHCRILRGSRCGRSVCMSSWSGIGEYPENFAPVRNRRRPACQTNLFSNRVCPAHPHRPRRAAARTRRRVRAHARHSSGLVSNGRSTTRSTGGRRSDVRRRQAACVAVLCGPPCSHGRRCHWVSHRQQSQRRDEPDGEHCAD